MLFTPPSAVENTRNLAQSALPDAPVIADEPRTPRQHREIRARLATALRATSHRSLRLADRIDPAPSCG